MTTAILTYKQAAKPQINLGLLYEGRAYRARTLTMLPPGLTAADIVRYDGNVQDLTTEIIEDLHDFPTRMLLWVYKTREQCEALHPGQEVLEFDFDWALILSRDPQGGYLLLLDSPLGFLT